MRCLECTSCKIQCGSQCIVTRPHQFRRWIKVKLCRLYDAHTTLNVLLWVFQKVNKFLTVLDDHRVSILTIVIADGAGHHLCPVFYPCRDEYLTALARQSHRDGKVLACLKIVCSISLLLLSFCTIDISSVVRCIEREILVREIDFGNDILVFSLSPIVVWLHDGIIASCTHIRCSLTIGIFRIVDEVLACPWLRDSKLREANAIRREAVDCHSDVFFCLVKGECLTTHTLSCLEDNGNPGSLVLHIQRYLLIVLIAAHHQATL